MEDFLIGVLIIFVFFAQFTVLVAALLIIKACIKYLKN